MNWTDEEIDKLFQESASQMNVPYQDSFWNEMEALLPQKEKKKGLGWIFGGTLTCFALIAAMIASPGNQQTLTGQQASMTGHDLDIQSSQLASEIQLALEQDASTNAQQPVPQASKINMGTNRSGTRNNPAATHEQRRTTPGNQMIPDAIVPVEDQGLLADWSTENVNADEQTDGSERLEFLAMEGNVPQLAASRLGKFSPRTKKNTFYAQAGFGISQSYISGTDKSWMTSVNLGAGYQYKPQGFGFSAGLNLNSSFANNMEITRRSKVYNFSSTNYEQKLMYKQLYSIEMPISVDFRKDRHTISFGVAPTYLATTVMRLTQFENDQLSDNRVYVGQKAGMNSFGLKTGIAYQLEVARSWNIGVQLNAQMIKQVDETQFVGDLTKLPLSGQITIRKTLTK